MPRVSKKAFSNSTSEEVSASDSDSSSDSITQYGSGDEGAAIPTGNANDISSTNAPTPTPYGFPGPLRAIVGTFCAVTAVAGGIMLIYGGIPRNYPVDDQADLHRAMVGSGAAILGIGSLASMLCLVRPPYAVGQSPVVSA
jgi:hypothetical protein